MVAFAGFGPKALSFFEALAFHQTRDWFEENRKLYETDVKGPFGLLVEDLASELARRKIPLKGGLGDGDSNPFGSPPRA